MKTDESFSSMLRDLNWPNESSTEEGRECGKLANLPLVDAGVEESVSLFTDGRAVWRDRGCIPL